MAHQGAQQADGRRVVTDLDQIHKAIADVNKFIGFVDPTPGNLEAAANELQEIAGRLLVMADARASVATEGAQHDSP